MLIAFILLSVFLYGFAQLGRDVDPKTHLPKVDPPEEKWERPEFPSGPGC